jgi:hypothetical protein
MKTDLSKKDVDIANAAKSALEDKKYLLELVTNLRSKKETVRFNSSKALHLISQQNPEVLYPLWDLFFDLIGGGNTYWKCSGIPIIANLTRIDKEKRFERMFEKFFGLMDDKKSFIPAAYLARSSATIVRAKPNLETKITKRLMKIDETRHDPQRRDLVKSDIIEAFDDYYEQARDKKEIMKFVRNQLECDSPKTRRRARTFLEKREKQPKHPRTGKAYRS